MQSALQDSNVEESEVGMGSLFLPARRESVCEFVEEHVELPTGAITGNIRLERIPHAREPLERFADRTARHLVLVAGTQSAKALALDTPLPTPEGWTTVGDSRVGDKLIGRNGLPTTIIKKTEIFLNRDCYRVTFGCGDSVVADAGHLWSVIRRKRNWNGGREKSSFIEEIVETTGLRSHKRCPHRMPVASPIQAAEQTLPIQPYTLGVWLGDGHSAAARMTCSVGEYNHFHREVASDGYRLGFCKRDRNTYNPTIHGISKKLRALGLLNNKRIPQKYLRASEVQRWALLQGLMDTDGTCVKKGTEASLTTVHPKLHEGVMELLSSLGLKPRSKGYIAKIKGKPIGPAFKIKFHPNGNPIFRMQRKQRRVVGRSRDNFAGHEIKSIERIASVPVQCIAVDSDDHLFLCGRSMVPTHNTTILICGMLFRIAKDPEDAMWVFGNADQARDFNKERFMSFAELCKPVNDLIPRTKENVIDKTRWGFRNQHYLSMVLNFIGSGSRTQLSSRPRGLMLMDETDKYAEELKFDAGTIELAEERMKTFPFPLSVKASSPSEKHRMIWAEYEKTDMRQYWVPCPRCGEEILLKMKVETEKLGDCGIRWWHESPEEAKTDGIWDLKKIKNNAYYKCQKCAGMIHEFERFDMVNNGIWIPSNKQSEEGRYGYQISSLCSVIGPETSLGSIAVKFMSAKGNRMELKNFVNGWLAEPWDESMGYDQGTVKLEVFNENSIPKDGSFAIMATDFQINGFWTLVRKFAPPTPEHPFGQSWLVLADWIQTEDEIEEVKKEYGVLDEDCVLDMARRPNAAAKIIIEHKMRGMWGSPNTKQFWHRQPDGSRVSRPYSTVQYRDPMLGTAWENRTIERAIFVNFAKDAALDAVSALRYAHPTIWHASTNVNPKYARHINAFQKRQVKSKRTGRMEWVWMNVHNEDHLADCECMVTIRAMQRGLIILPPSSGREEAA